MRIFTAAAFVFLILLSTSAHAQSDSVHNAAQELLRRGIEACDAGDYEEALDLYDQANEIDPSTSTYRYEEAYVHYARGDYQKAINVLTAIVDAPDASDRYYSLLGNGYDLIGKRSKAVATYKEGIKHFPNSGKIYLELGVIAATDNDFKQALDFWEKGIEVEPSHPSNYYWAAKIHCGLDRTRAWGIVYAEIFLNLERNTKRSKEISSLLFETYRSLISVKQNMIAIAPMFTDPVMDTATGEMTIHFEQAYATNMMPALTIQAIIPIHNGVDIGFLYSARSHFIDMWYQDSLDQYFPNFLFDWQKMLIEGGGFEAYTYWLLNQGDEGEAAEWFRSHADNAESFLKWFKENPLQINRVDAWNRNSAGSISLEKWTALRSREEK